jgi:hypothetical protein
MIITRKSKYGTHEIIIDEQDMHLIKSWSLYVVYNKTSNCFKAKIYRTEGNKQVFHYLHRFLLNCGQKDVVKHLNGNSLDCGRDNIIKQTYSDKMKYARNHWKDKKDE